MLYSSDNTTLLNPGNPKMTPDDNEIHLTSTPLVFQNSTCLLNALLQLWLIFHLAFSEPKIFTEFRDISKIFRIFPISSIIRSISFILASIYLSFYPPGTSEYTVISTGLLYIDYCCNYMCMLLILLASVNRVLFFIKPRYFKKCFPSGEVGIYSWLVSAAALAFWGSILFVKGAQPVKINYFECIGFVAVGDGSIWHKFLTILVYTVLIGSLICYSFIYRYLHKMSRTISAPRNRNPHKQKMFQQVLVTAVVYLIVQLFNEFIYFKNLTEFWKFQTTFVNLFNVSSFIPEMVIPLWSLADWLKIKYIAWITSENTIPVYTIPNNVL
ncbi:hypothetical protein GCK72_011582 [Caenorhabditis remanei]|uniref:G-protein coupled receptors family 1 profile domain-containing protein n=1 Tax=Caenorhabditis remanei TaxID=31234 RepID=A0A6A5H8U6_CAERE|nr:hypothetical protein GCK72_011582 [Caenorhabditis remanei]KAF1763316.1 hypothetical protein GCK72_011582 [Caenorhabditis remanei]